jgi:DNA-directed RNA polymerase specialized sigma24 family protein
VGSGDGRSRGFSDALVREHDALLGLAHLLEGDPDAADALFHRALVATAGSRRTGGDPASAVRRQLVRRHLAASGKPAGSGFVDIDPWDLSGDPLRRALDDLPAPTRAATVLAVSERRPPGDVARLTGLDEAAARAAVDEGAGRLRAALGLDVPSLYASGTGSVALDVDAELGRELALLARPPARPGGEPRPEPEQFAATVVREAAVRRRRRWAGALGGAGTAVAVTAALVLVPDGRTSPPARDPGAAPSPPASEPTERWDQPVGGVPESLLSGAPRGGLADDPELLEALRGMPWASPDFGDLPVPDPDTVEVLFADDVPGGRWVLLSGRANLPGQDVGFPDSPPSVQPVTAWFTGPPGAAPDELVMRTYPFPPGVPAASLVDPLSGTFVVMTDRDAEVQVSRGVDIAADGSMSRTWEALPLDDGVAVGAVPPVGPYVGSSFTLRVQAPGFGFEGWPEYLYTEVGDVPPPRALPLRELRPLDGAERDLVRAAASNLMGQLGLEPDDVEVVGHWAGGVPVEGMTVHAAAVTLTVASGAVVAGIDWSGGVTDGTGTLQQPCGQETRPAGTDPERRVYAAVCHVFDWTSPEGGAPTDLLVVVAPPSVTSVRAYSHSGTFLSEHEATDGVAVVPLPDNTGSVEAVTDHGVSLGRSPLLEPFLDLDL